MMKNNIAIRCVVLVIGLFIMAFGVALSVKANLGTSPISCIPYVYSLGYPITIGTASIVMNLLLILLQVVLLRRSYQLVQLLQLPVALFFGVFIDVAMHLLSGVDATTYWTQWLLCLLSCAILAFGVFLEVKAKVTYLAGEGLSLAIAKTFHVEFGKAKVGLDCSLVVIGVASSFILLHDLQGIREGTIAAALLVGTIARFYGSKLSVLDRYIGVPVAAEDTAIEAAGGAADRRMVVTIAREYGSGGHEIGELVAQKLGIAFYDTTLIDLSAAEGGFTPEYVKAHEQKLANSLLFDLYEQNYAYVNEEMPPLDSLFMVQSKVIRDISKRESCVIVGRCADFVLKGHPHCLNVFVHADKSYRIQRVIGSYGVAPALAEREMERKDRERMNYSKHYTHRVWNDTKSYHLTLDNSLFGPEKSAALIVDAVQKMMERAE
jgi:uncharacterized membrane protein YczE/cytidylate kinase